MKKSKIVLFLLLGLTLSSCNNFHTGKVVFEDENKDEKPLNVKYIIVDEKDKDSLIENIKNGKGAVINRKKVITQDSNKDNDDKENENN